MKATRPALPSATAHVERLNSKVVCTKAKASNSRHLVGRRERPVRGSIANKNNALKLSLKAVNLKGGASIRPTLITVQPYPHKIDITTIAASGLPFNCKRGSSTDC